MENKTTKRGINHGIELPNHAYHPNVSLRQTTRSGYIAWPDKGVTNPQFTNGELHKREKSIY